MESSDSSPHYMKAKSSSLAKKENSPVESELEDSISASSSTVGSATKGQYVQQNKFGLQYRTNNKKTLRNSGNVKSSRRRAKSRILQPTEMSDNTSASGHNSLADASEASPHYLKSTSCSQGKKIYSQSTVDGTSSNFLRSRLRSSSRRSFQTLSRTSSTRNVRIQLKNTSFKLRRPLLYHSVSEDLAVHRATYSSTVKDTKFPEPVDVCPEEAELGKLSGTKVCRYHHCSLYGRCREDHDAVSPPKHFLNKKRRSFKKQKSKIPEIDPCSCERTDYTAKTMNQQKSQMVSITNSSLQEGKMEGTDFFLPFSVEHNSEACIEGYGGIQDFDILEIAYGEKSFPERSYQESLNITREYTLRDHQFGGESFGQRHCLTCSCYCTEEVVWTPRSSDRASNSIIDEESITEMPLNGDVDVLDSQSSDLFENSKELKVHCDDHACFISDECQNESSSKDCPETPVVFDTITKDIRVSSSVSYSQTSSDNCSEVDGELAAISSVTENSIESFKIEQTPESLNDASTSEGNKLQFSKPRHMSMWYLIHQHMASELATEAGNKPLPAAEDQDFVDNNISSLAKESSAGSNDFSVTSTGVENDSETQEIEIRKLFAIKQVREAIEKILLPEVQDDQSVTSESISPKEITEKRQNEGWTEESYGNPDANKDERCVPSTPEEISPVIEDSLSSKMFKTAKSSTIKSDRKAPRHWSNLKKWILLQRFIRELEKVRKFNPKKPQLLPLNRDPEAEKVILKPPAVDEKKRGEEWMLDYALRQALNQLAPTQKRKVALLVKAFETVVPPQEDYQIHHRRGKSVVSGSLPGDDKVSCLVSAKQEIGTTLVKNYSNLSASNDDRGEKVARNAIKTEPGDSKSSVTTKSLIIEPGIEFHLEDKRSEGKNTNGAVDDELDRKDRIKMWHVVYQHVVSGIAEKMGSQLLGGSDDEIEDAKSPDVIKENHVPNNPRSRFSKQDALKLVKEAVDEILLPKTQDYALDSPSVSTEQEISEEDIGEVGEQQKTNATNWKKLKKLLLLKKSIDALEKARKLTQTHELLGQNPDLGPDRADLKHCKMDEKKKAEQWMLDYAVQHIVTKLNPARKRRVSMLVEAFDAVVPFPEI